MNCRDGYPGETEFERADGPDPLVALRREKVEKMRDGRNLDGPFKKASVRVG